MITADNFFGSDIILENKRARLTPLKITDVEELEKVAYDPQIWKLGMSDIRERKDLAAYIETALSERERRQSYPFLIFDRQSGAVAGSTRFGNISLENKRVEIGWTWMHPEFQGTGLNKSCKFLLLQFAFETLQLNRVELKTDILNQQSRKAMRKIGATEEGIFRRHSVTSSGRIRDSIFFSIIREDWPGIKNTIFSDLL